MSINNPTFAFSCAFTAPNPLVKGSTLPGSGTLPSWVAFTGKRETVQTPQKRKPAAKNSPQPVKKSAKSRQQEKKGVVKPGKSKPEGASKSPFLWLEAVKRWLSSIKGRFEPQDQPPIQLRNRAPRSAPKESAGQAKVSSSRAKTNQPRARLATGQKLVREPQKIVVRPRKSPLKVQPVALKVKNNDEIRLLGELEHRCPFCLEVVEKNDPRGVKICKVCHTHHHADCWAVTGACQAPHHHG